VPEFRDNERFGTIIAPSINNLSKEDFSVMGIEPSRQTKKTKPRAPKATPRQAVAHTSTHTRKSVSSCDDLHALIAKRAYELYSERGYRHGYAIDDWLDAEREILSQLPPA